MGAVENKDPRSVEDKLSGKGRRARNAMNNHSEQFAFFAIAAVANLALRPNMGDNQGKAVAALSMVHAGTRFFHAMFYIYDLDVMRSIVFTVGISCNLALYVLAIAAASN